MGKKGKQEKNKEKPSNLRQSVFASPKVLELGAWHLGYFRAEIPPGSHGDLSLVLPDVAALVPMGMVAALTSHTSQHTARDPRDGEEGRGVAAGDTTGVGGRDPPSALHFPAQLSGTHIQSASFIPSSVPCPGAVFSKPRLDFLDFAGQC